MTFSGQSPASARRPLGPFGERRVRRREQARDRRLVERARQRERRQPRAVQDLVGVGVADAAEEARIGQRALEVWFSRDERVRRTRRASPSGRRGRRGRARRARLRPATRCSDARRFLPASVSSERAVSNSNEGERVRRRLACPARSQRRRPAIIRWTTRKSSPSKRDDDALAEPPTPTTLLAFDGDDRRRHRAQQERVADAHALEPVADDLGRRARST